MPITAYSYVRFSTIEQLKGDSLRRQLSQSQEYCQQNGFVLDTSLTLRDMGIRLGVAAMSNREHLERSFEQRTRKSQEWFGLDRGVPGSNQPAEAD